jgi:hypothetical protein
MKTRIPSPYIVLLVSLALVVLQGCSTFPDSNTGHKLGTLTLNHLIVVPASNTRVFMQDGKVVDGFNDYRPNCNIEVRRRDDGQQQSINPAVYDVVYIQQTTEEVVNIYSDKPVLLAFGNVSNKKMQLGLSSLGSSPSDIYRGYHFGLSGEDKNVFRLSCRGVYAPPDEARLPEFTEIKQVLGEIMSLSLDN